MLNFREHLKSLYYACRKMSLQSNTMFHLGGFLNPMDGLIKRFTVLFVKDTEFTGCNSV